MTRTKSSQKKSSAKVEPEPAKRRAGKSVPPDPRKVLSEVYELLEQYAPTWYSESISGRIQAALSLSSQAIPGPKAKKSRR